jgi:hypothetical protein
LILENFNVIGGDGERFPLYPTSREWIDATFGGPSTANLPRFFGMVDDQDVVLGPWPDQAYACEFIGKFRPTPLYTAPTPPTVAGAQTTYLTTVYPDLFLAAAMISAAGYQKNFGAQADDPKMAMSWETQFQTLLPSAKMEEARKRFSVMGMSSVPIPPPIGPPAAPGG